MWDTIKQITGYLFSEPPTFRGLVYRVVLAVVVGLVLVRLSAIQHGQITTRREVQEVATAIATALPLEPTPTRYQVP
jgi:hypothetical protein